MDLESARVLLGLGQQISLGEVERAFTSRREITAQRASTAPTEALRAKYQQALDELEHARQAVLAHLRPSAPNLSRTQMDDLPGAQPVYTQSGLSATASVANRIENGQVLASRYEIREQIGIGGMGAVYRAFDRNRNEEIAIKVLLPHLLSHQVARERFLVEAKVASSLSHPNIVNVFDVQRDGRNDFLTMELLHGQTLRQLMLARRAARRPFSVDEAVEVATAIGSALTQAHKQTVHRDVKPENVWVEDDGNYKLMDFGIARLMSTSQLSQTSTALGTAYYMAPEQLRAAKTVDGRADQYALAVMMYELISGEIPAGRIKPLHLVRKDVPRGLSQAIDRALEPQPEARFATMGDFVKAMSARGRVFSGGVGRTLAIAAALLLLAGGTAMFWPQIKALMPDRAGAQLLRGQSIQAQGVIETLLKRLDASERDLDSQVRDAKSAVDRYDSMARMARSEEEKRDLAARLRDAQAQLALAGEVRDASATWVFRSDSLARVRGQLSLGGVALRDGDFQGAADNLLAAQKTVEQLLEVPEQARAAITARGAYEKVLSNLSALGKQEKKEVSAYLTAASSTSKLADDAFKEGRFRDASEAYVRAASETGKSLDTMVDELVAAYRAFAEKAMGSGRLEEASAAVSRAKALLQMKQTKP